MNSTYTMDTIIKTNQKLCINCGACIRACPCGLIVKDTFPVPTEESWNACIDCGHCVAICPTGALQQRAMGPDDCEPIDTHLIPRWDQVRQVLITRRSIRSYSNKPIEQEKILQLLDVSRFASNGGNRQVLRWFVINDPAKVNRISGMAIDWMKTVKDKNPALYQEAKMELYVGSWALGKDRISWGAPCILMACAPKDERSALPAAMIAHHQIQLSAPLLGLGTTFTGTINMASQGSLPLIEMLGLPEGYTAYATSVIGYPADKYRRIPVRKPIDVTWR